MTEVGQRLNRVNELLTILFRESDHDKRIGYLYELMSCYEWLADYSGQCADTERQLMDEKAGLRTPPEEEDRPHVILFAKQLWGE